MRILLTNDDGIYAPGLAAMQRELDQIAEVHVVAPATEQSGVAHSITFLNPLVPKEIYDGPRRRGWAVEGSPADSVKLGIVELCPRPDLVVSGINGGLNAGINVLYSGTVAAAIEGAFFGITSIAVSLEYDEHANFARAAQMARQVIEQIWEQKEAEPQLYNLNIPTAAVVGETEKRAAAEPPEVRVVPMGIAQYGQRFDKRRDPKGRTYYWATDDPPPQAAGHETDLSALEKGFITLTPLQYDMTKASALTRMRQWRLELES